MMDMGGMARMDGRASMEGRARMEGRAGPAGVQAGEFPCEFDVEIHGFRENHIKRPPYTKGRFLP